MDQSDDIFFSANRIINAAFNQKGWISTLPIQELFDHKLEDLKISKNQAIKILDIETKSFDLFMSGNSKKIDFMTIIKLSIFFEMTSIDVIEKIISKIENENHDEIYKTKTRYFIAKNFNLDALKKIGFIESVNDFEEIEKKILTFFGFETVFQYNTEVASPAYSSAKIQSNTDSLKFWVNTSKSSFARINNPNDYNRLALVNLFPTIRAYSLNMDFGLVQVAKLLYKIGVTLIYVPKMQKDMHIRAATMSINNKPCIVLTNYKDMYPTLWFALIHELYHVLYDWDEISNSQNQTHLSADLSESTISEEAANDFAKKYLFSDEKFEALNGYMNNHYYVSNFARENNVHYSIVYGLYAYDNPKYFAKYKKYIPNCAKALSQFDPAQYENFKPIPIIAKTITSLIK